MYTHVCLCNIYFFAIVLEVYQFARDAAVAEAWLIAQEPYLMSQELGVSNYLYEHKLEFLIERASLFKKENYYFHSILSMKLKI